MSAITAVRTCIVCRESILDDDVHTDPETGQDVHGHCCTACGHVSVARRDLDVALSLLSSLVEDYAPTEMAALDRLQTAVTS